MYIRYHFSAVISQTKNVEIETTDKCAPMRIHYSHDVTFFVWKWYPASNMDQVPKNHASNPESALLTSQELEGFGSMSAWHCKTPPGREGGSRRTGKERGSKRGI
jgi:hypothetical protein